MLDLFRRDVIYESPDAHDKKIFDTDEASDRLLQKVSTPSSFMAAFTTFAQRKSETALAN